MIDHDLLTEIQYAVVEPPNGGASWPSGLWTGEEVVGYCNQRQDRLLKETHLRSTEVAAPGLPIPAGTTTATLPADWLGTVQVAWRDDPPTLPVRSLHRGDTFEADHASDVWGSTPAVRPTLYVEYESPTLQVQVLPASVFPGRLHLRYVAQGTPLTGEGVSLTVPDDLASTVKYGALAALLSKDGRAQDVQRAAYCEDRYRLGIEAIQILLAGGA